LAPSVVRVAVMYNPETNPFYTGFLRSFTTEPRALGVELREALVRTEADIEATIAKLAQAPDGGLLVAPDSFTVVHRGLIMRTAMQHRLPATFGYRRFVAEGALMAYGPDTKDIFRRSVLCRSYPQGCQSG